jgi:hypothetical protein
MIFLLHFKPYISWYILILYMWQKQHQRV